MASADADVTTDDVRTSLAGIDESNIPEATIEQALSMARTTVEGKLSGSGVRAEAKRNAILAVARRMAFMSTPPKLRAQAVDGAVQYSIDEFIEELRYREEEMLAAVGAAKRTSFRAARSR